MGVMKYQAPLTTSKLNPNASIFVPMKSYLTVEDFSSQWWDLIHSSPFFRDFWLRDCFQDPSECEIDSDLHDLNLPDFDAFYEFSSDQEKVEEEEKVQKDLITLGALKWSRTPKAELPKTFQKVPKIVKNIRASPRTIHQPR